MVAMTLELKICLNIERLPMLRLCREEIAESDHQERQTEDTN